MEAILIDTNVLLGRMRRQPEAFRIFERVDEQQPVICDVVLAEILAGARNQKEFEKHHHELTTNFHILPFTMDVSKHFRKILSEIAPHHDVHLSDHLIAAIAIAHDVPLLTLNTKHFKGIKGLQLA
jgi:predicted nucleic acid-binding protein